MPVTWVLDPPVFIPLPGVPLPPEGTILSELEVPDSYVVPEATLVVPNDVLLVPSFISTPVVAPKRMKTGKLLSVKIHTLG